MRWMVGPSMLQLILGANRGIDRHFQYRSQGFDFDWQLGQVSIRLRVGTEIVARRGKYSYTVEARSVLC